MNLDGLSDALSPGLMDCLYTICIIWDNGEYSISDWIRKWQSKNVCEPKKNVCGFFVCVCEP